ncbi:MAG TPA: hypothetical protein PLK30_27515 [Blastocatellia bacterium]|nr:hypothetical protein [Blastocatellia bacterium]
MTPEVPYRASQSLAPISSLDELLVFPVPAGSPARRPVWMDCLNDLSFLLPAFGTLLGLLLLLGQSPFLGATAVTLCPVVLAIRIRSALRLRRERRQISALVRWYQNNRVYCLDRQQLLDEELPDVMYCPVPPVR